METEIQKSPTDEIIENAKKTEELGATSFMEPKVKEVKKRGRPPKDKTLKSEESKKQDNKAGPDTSGPAFDIPTKTLCYLPGKMVSSWGVAYTRDPRAAMTGDELEAFATGLGMVIDKHLPDAMKNYGPELMFAMALTQYGVRILAIKKIQAENRAKQSQNAAMFKKEDKKDDAPVQETTRQDVKLVDTYTETPLP